MKCGFGLLQVVVMHRCCFLQASGEVDANGFPRGFFQPLIGVSSSFKDYPVMITTQMSAARAQDSLRYFRVCLQLVHLDIKRFTLFSPAFDSRFFWERCQSLQKNHFEQASAMMTAADRLSHLDGGQCAAC